jgi:hypothetical protein
MTFTDQLFNGDAVQRNAVFLHKDQHFTNGGPQLAIDYPLLLGI